MRGFSLLLPLAASLVTALPQHVHDDIPEVDQYQQSARQRYDNWLGYHGPSGHDADPPRPATNTSTNTGGSCSFWMEEIAHQGISAFNPNTGYQVFRNVKDFGAKGDGVTDDTAAINAAISSGGRCAPYGACQSSTIYPAVVYFPAGTYVVSSSIIDYYYTQIIGNPNCMPTLLPTANFTGFGVIDGDPYGANGLSYGSTNVFWRQVRNFIIDTTGVAASSHFTGIHWPTAQATSLQNILFRMPEAAGVQHQGVFIESGSGGFMNDLTFVGGLYGLNVGNQQFTMRNLTFNNVNTAISQIWDWGWSYQNININNCSIGLDMSDGGAAAQAVGSIVFFDSSISNTPVGIRTAHNATSLPMTAGSLILENVQFNNVPTAVQGPGATVALAGTTGSMTVQGWGEGHAYTPTGPVNFEQSIAPNPRPASLLSGNKYYQRSKPQYQNVPVSDFLSARSAGAAGNGVTDDTNAIQAVILQAAQTGKVLFVDAGTYKLTSTVYVPAGTKMVGESYSVFMSSGSYFNDMNNPQPMIQVGRANGNGNGNGNGRGNGNGQGNGNGYGDNNNNNRYGEGQGGQGESGVFEWSDMIVSTQGQQRGAVLIEYNLASYGTPSGMWDVHARVGGFAGSNLQLAECPITPGTATPPAPANANCIAAFMTMHVTKSAYGLYMENVWVWVADHDVDDPNLTQITIYAGRGLYIESQAGTLWLVGTAVEHHEQYQYQLANTKDIFMGFIQTETAYYQPNPNATYVFPPVAALNDPTFRGTDAETPPAGLASPNQADGWGLRVLSSQYVLVYGAGLYSFFANWSTTCSNQGGGEVCQAGIFSFEGNYNNVNIYCLSTVGTTSMINRNGQSLASYADNLDGFVDTIALFRSNGPAV